MEEPFKASRIPEEELDMDLFIGMLESIWEDRVDASQRPSATNFLIQVYETPTSFAAELPTGRGTVFTGLGGFLKFWKKDMPVSYNGTLLPKEEYDNFHAYCSSLLP